MSFKADGAIGCEADDTVLLHSRELGRELSRLVLPNPAWQQETQHWGAVQHLGAGLC